MNTITVKIWDSGQRMYVDSVVPAVISNSGVLAAHKNTNPNGRGWNVTHVKTGAMITTLRGKNAAIEFMKAFDKFSPALRDVKPGKSVNALPAETVKAMRAVLDEFRSSRKLVI